MGTNDCGIGGTTVGIGNRCGHWERQLICRGAGAYWVFPAHDHTRLNHPDSSCCVCASAGHTLVSASTCAGWLFLPSAWRRRGRPGAADESLRGGRLDRRLEGDRAAPRIHHRRVGRRICCCGGGSGGFGRGSAVCGCIRARGCGGDRPPRCDVTRYARGWLVGGGYPPTAGSGPTAVGYGPTAVGHRPTECMITRFLESGSASVLGWKEGFDNAVVARAAAGMG